MLLLTESAPLPVPVMRTPCNLFPSREKHRRDLPSGWRFHATCGSTLDVTSDLSASGDGVKVGEVVLIAAPAKGFELEMLTVVACGAPCWLPIRWQRRKLSVGGRRKTPKFRDTELIHSIFGRPKRVVDDEHQASKARRRP